MLSLRTIEPHTLELLRSITAQPALQQTRLVGGTALALQYGHRTSVDLDFFGTLPDEPNVLLESVAKIGETTIIHQTKSIIQIVVDKVKVDFVNYSRYEWIDEPILSDGITLASDKDIAAMKVNAIMGRGTRKDFVDLYALLQHYSLADILSFYRKKYPEYSDYRALLSMTYFVDAEMLDMPRLFIDVSWEEMKRTIIAAVKEYQQ